MWRTTALASLALPLIAFTSLASSSGREIVIGHGLDGVQIGEGQARVRRTLGPPQCACSRLLWKYDLLGSGLAMVYFDTSGRVRGVLAYDLGPGDHLSTAQNVKLGSTLADVKRALPVARCALASALEPKAGPPPGVCAIVSRVGSSDVETTFTALILSSVRGAVNEVGVFVLGSATAETISMSVAPRTISVAASSTANVTATVTSPPLNDFPNGLGIAGDHVTFSSADPHERISRVVDQGDGTYTATITGAKRVGAITIAATDGAATGRVKLKQSKS